MRGRYWLAAGAVTIAVATAAFAQGDGMAGMHGMAHGEPGPATAAFTAINDEMHAAMMIEYTGDPDVDFALAMIAHHQGAVAMARVVIEHGTDPEIRALAEGIIEAQEAEIAWMEAWLAARAK